MNNPNNNLFTQLWIGINGMVTSFPSISAFSLIAKDDFRLKSVLLASEALLEHDGESYPSSCIFEKLLASLNSR